LSVPARNISNQSFLTGARVAVTTAAGYRELLQRYGMPDTFPEDLGGMLDRFEAALNEKHAGRAAHVGARAELDAVTAEIMQLVGQLDAPTGSESRAGESPAPAAFYARPWG
jgi:hypothetical protein